MNPYQPPQPELPEAQEPPQKRTLRARVARISGWTAVISGGMYIAAHVFLQLEIRSYSVTQDAGVLKKVRFFDEMATWSLLLSVVCFIIYLLTMPRRDRRDD